jgi:hypothetical protein
LIVGGKNSVGEMRSVEAVNWKTKEQCRLADLPEGIRIHSGAVLYGVPVVCGGFAFEIPLQTCHKFKEETGKWTTVRIINHKTFQSKNGHRRDLNPELPALAAGIIRILLF